MADSESNLYKCIQWKREAQERRLLQLESMTDDQRRAHIREREAALLAKQRRLAAARKKAKAS